MLPPLVESELPPVDEPAWSREHVERRLVSALEEHAEGTLLWAVSWLTQHAGDPPIAAIEALIHSADPVIVGETLRFLEGCPPSLFTPETATALASMIAGLLLSRDLESTPRTLAVSFIGRLDPQLAWQTVRRLQRRGYFDGDDVHFTAILRACNHPAAVVPALQLLARAQDATQALDLFTIVLRHGHTDLIESAWAQFLEEFERADYHDMDNVNVTIKDLLVDCFGPRTLLEPMEKAIWKSATSEEPETKDALSIDCILPAEGTPEHERAVTLCPMSMLQALAQLASEYEPCSMLLALSELAEEACDAAAEVVTTDGDADRWRSLAALARAMARQAAEAAAEESSDDDVHGEYSDLQFACCTVAASLLTCALRGQLRECGPREGGASRSAHPSSAFVDLPWDPATFARCLPLITPEVAARMSDQPGRFVASNARWALAAHGDGRVLWETLESTSGDWVNRDGMLRVVALEGGDRSMDQIAARAVPGHPKPLTMLLLVALEATPTGRSRSVLLSAETASTIVPHTLEARRALRLAADLNAPEAALQTIHAITSLNEDRLVSILTDRDEAEGARLWARIVTDLFALPIDGAAEISMAIEFVGASVQAEGLASDATSEFAGEPNWSPEDSNTCFDGDSDGYGEELEDDEHSEPDEDGEPSNDEHFDAETLASVEPIVWDAPDIQPNDPCPCGSARKYKRCCGTE